MELNYHNANLVRKITSTIALSGVPVKENKMTRDDFNAKYPGNTTGIVFTVDGQPYISHLAVCNFLANNTKTTMGLLPDNFDDKVKVWNVCDSTRQAESGISRNEYSNEDALGFLEALMAKKGFAVGGSVTIADCHMDNMENNFSLKSNAHQASMVQMSPKSVKSIYAVRNNKLVKDHRNKRKSSAIEDAE